MYYNNNPTTVSAYLEVDIQRAIPQTAANIHTDTQHITHTRTLTHCLLNPITQTEFKTGKTFLSLIGDKLDCSFGVIRKHAQLFLLEARSGRRINMVWM